MIDRYGRTIDYLRISVTDRCNLRCRYCMPNGMSPVQHAELLTYEELLRIAQAAVSLGVACFKVTGGEPLARKGCLEFVARLKALHGVEQVTLTTNGLLLNGSAEALKQAGVDAVNISMDTLSNERFCAITGYEGDAISSLEALLKSCTALGVRAKINAVLMRDTLDDLPRLTQLAKDAPIDVRLIELMPIGEGAYLESISSETALERLRQAYPDLRPTDEHRGNGPARYFETDALMGRIGVIDAISHQFCEQCNRVRLTSLGKLKPCLCYDDATDLRALIRSGASDAALADAMRQAIFNKPASHCFLSKQAITEHRNMNEIGG